MNRRAKNWLRTVKHWIKEALKQLVGVDSARAVVTMGELPRHREVQPSVLPVFDEHASPHACVMGGDEVLILRKDEQGTQTTRRSRMKVGGLH